MNSTHPSHSQGDTDNEYLMTLNTTNCSLMGKRPPFSPVMGCDCRADSFITQGPLQLGRGWRKGQPAVRHSCKESRSLRPLMRATGRCSVNTVEDRPISYRPEGTGPRQRCSSSNKMHCVLLKSPLNYPALPQIAH